MTVATETDNTSANVTPQAATEAAPALSLPVFATRQQILKIDLPAWPNSQQALLPRPPVLYDEIEDGAVVSEITVTVKTRYANVVKRNIKHTIDDGDLNEWRVSAMSVYADNVTREFQRVLNTVRTWSRTRTEAENQGASAAAPAVGKPLNSLVLPVKNPLPDVTDKR